MQEVCINAQYAFKFFTAFPCNIKWRLRGRVVTVLKTEIAALSAFIKNSKCMGANGKNIFGDRP